MSNKEERAWIKGILIGAMFICTCMFILSVLNVTLSALGWLLCVVLFAFVSAAFEND